MPPPGTAMSEQPILIGISQCLLGDAVRYDGGHKRSTFCTETLAPFVRYVPVCPEMAIGLGAPREPIHLQGEPGSGRIRVVGNRTPSLDVTEKLETFGQQKAEELEALSGYIFMGRSPSCGLARITVYHENGNPLGSSMGVYAREITRHLPLLPVEEEGRLRDSHLRENFVARVYAYHRWQRLQQEGMTLARLQDFHARHKYTLLAHQQAAYKHLGRLVALAHQRPLDDVAAEYIRGFMQALKIVASNQNHSNVLLHIMGYLKRDLDSASRQELVTLIDRYRRGEVPLIAPLTLLRHHFQHHPNAYIARQYYLEPYPPELLLRNFH